MLATFWDHIHAEGNQAYFGPPEQRWRRADEENDLGISGYWQQVFTGGSVLRSLVVAAQIEGVEVAPERLLQLKNYLMDARFWQPEEHSPLVIPAEHGQFWGHHHSYTQALLGLLYYAHFARDERVKQFVIEGYLPLENIKIGRDDGSELDALKQLVRNMGQAGVGILCYNFMAGTDWVRTRLDIPERGGAKVTAFDLAEVKRAILLGHDGAEFQAASDAEEISADTLWRNLETFLKELVPVAEASNAVLAMHPDDPPLPKLLGKARIMNRAENFERLVETCPSPSNAICFCQGTFAEMGVDIPATIRQLGK